MSGRESIGISVFLPREGHAIAFDQEAARVEVGTAITFKDLPLGPSSASSPTAGEQTLKT